MLRTVGKKVGKTYRRIGSFSSAPLGALHNNPPQRGGLKHSPKFCPANPLCTALSGRLLGNCYPPRCGGLLCVAPKGAEEKLAILAPCVT
jgi:hypothetical protein